ncbi:MAG: beta-glucosidase [Planctomycetaceae bacterium]|nr:beta-glucosidase [Planctomycetaceae bacterium]
MRGACVLGYGVWITLTLVCCLPVVSAPVAGTAPAGVAALGRQLRIDVLWEGSAQGNVLYQVRRAESADGEFTIMPHHVTLPVFTDFVGEPGKTFYYQVRAGRESNKRVIATSTWSKTVSAATGARNHEGLLAEVQEASVRCYTLASHPNSGMVKEWISTRKWPSRTRRGDRYGATGATGMGLSNLVVAVERGYLSRESAREKLLRTLRFLDTAADRFHGAYSHWIDNVSGKALPFSKYDDGGDLVETAMLAQGLIIVREYFSGDNPREKEIRETANRIWRAIDWNWYRKDGTDTLYWHWSPRFGWKMNLPVVGFCETEISYLLGIASPTHAIPASCYFRGWRHKRFGSDRKEHGIDLQLGRGKGGCTFWYYYSHIGLDPKRIRYKGRTMHEHFEDLCAVQIRYMRSRAGEFQGYDKMWGLTASPGPDGYRGHKPSPTDNGTIGPTASLSAYLYAPKASQECLDTMYDTYGKETWQELGFCEAFNPTRNWYHRGYLGIDAGTVAPMLENHRSGLLWRLFMNAPEIKIALDKLEAEQPGTVVPSRDLPE